MPDRSPSASFDPARVELTSPGTQAGWPFYVVDIVEVDDARACMWCGTDRENAVGAALDCAEGGLDTIDLAGPAPHPIVTGTLH